MTIGNGYTFTHTTISVAYSGLILGTMNGNYGWHVFGGGQTSPVTNASYVVFTYINTSDLRFASVTANALKNYDGTTITDNNITNYVNKLLYLVADCEVSFED